MLIAHKAVDQKIQSVKTSVGNTVTISPAGVRGFEGGGNPLTQAELTKVASLPHVTMLTETLNDRLTSSNTNLQSSISAGSLGQRFAGNSGETFTPPAGGGFGGGGGSGTTTFTPPVTVIGTNNPTDLADTEGGGTFTLKSGSVFTANSSQDVALLGTALASKNNLSVGSTFTAYNKTIKVEGIFDSGNTFSNGLLIMPLTTVQTLSSQSGDVTGAVATIDSVDNLGSTTTAITNSLGSVADVTNSQQNEEAIIQPLQNVQSISIYSLIGAVIAGSVIILLIMIMITRERRREIGVLKAIGASNMKIIFQFMSEAVTFTVLAAVIGIVIGVLAGNPITNTLVKNSSTSSTSTAGAFGGGGGGGGARAGGLTFRLGGGGFGRSISSIHASVGWTVILYGLGAALIIAIVGSSVASWFIAKIRPAEVMRVE